MANKTFTSIGQTLTEDVAKNKYSSTAYYTLRLKAKLNHISEDTLKANVTMEGILISKYISWEDDTIIFSLGVNGETVATASARNGGSNDSPKTYVEWTGDIPYKEDGTLIATLTASSSDDNGTYSPPNQTATIIATFPVIEVANVRLAIDGAIKKTQAYIGVGGVPKKCDVYVGNNGIPSKSY